MKDAIEIDSTCSAFPPGERAPHMTSILLSRSTRGAESPSSTVTSTTMMTASALLLSTEKQMVDANHSAHRSASRCRLIGNLSSFSEKTRRTISLKQRFRPDGDRHLLFLSF
jgi:hypothetical protein